MTWPQIVVALLLACNATVWIWSFAIADQVAERARIGGIIVVLILTAITVGVLSAGGFW